MYEVVGIERVSYKSKKSGNLVEGYRVYFTYDLVAGEGKGADVAFLSVDDFRRQEIVVGIPAMPVYNKYGRCTGFVDSV